MRERVAGALERLARERRDVAARIELAQRRVEFLTDALERARTASVAEEERLERVLSLSDQGLNTANAVANARLAALASATRMLTTEADLTDSRSKLQTLEQNRDNVDLESRQELLAQKLRAEQSLAEARARVEGLREEMALAGVLAAEAAAAAEAPAPPAHPALPHRRAGPRDRHHGGPGHRAAARRHGRGGDGRGGRQLSARHRTPAPDQTQNQNQTP